MNKMVLADSQSKKFNISKVGLIVLLSLVGVLVLGCASPKQQARNSENLKAQARAHSDLAAVYLQERKLEIALEEFTIAKNIDPTFGSAYNGLGLVHSALGQDDLAELNFRRAIQIEPNNSESRNNFGSFLCARNRIDESINEFMAAVSNPLYGTPAVAYTNAGICSLRKQDKVNAEIYFMKALQIEPLFHAAAYQLATIQFKRDDAIGAKNTLQNALLSQPGPELLWLAVQIARKLGDRDDEASYALQLRRQFPNSEQTKLLLSGK
ncbi:MAG: type IV pilus biogenesis/stability protein PilW [Betaproteobacteria bacterium HGW-Betaproteobacteria-22]|nr:MAG: type IV pilus biogenesis/stability protein PilW [Betaproteobacteria bacterium HGW-Betaproteobacteria-22]